MSNVRDLYREFFREAGPALRREAERAWQQTPIGQAVRLAQRAGRGTMPTGVARLATALRGGMAMGPSGILAAALGADLGSVAGLVARYARGSMEEQELLDAFFDTLGPLGDVLKHLLAPDRHRPPGGLVGRQIQAAIDFLESYGYDVIPPADWRTEGRWPIAEEELPTGVEREPGRRTVDVPMAGGPPRRLPPDHPLLSGDFQHAPGSSNVHSYAYDYDSATLYVRFLGRSEGGSRTGPGPLYSYTNVEPERFLELERAPSKGRWVWDHLRVRGTISGHQYDYQLLAVVGGYVPRKATLTPQGEAYMPRTLRVPGGQWLRSRRPEQVVRPLQPVGGR